MQAEQRKLALEDYGFTAYPRISVAPQSLSEFRNQWTQRDWGEDQVKRLDSPIYLVGRITSIRKLGSKLVFFHIADQQHNELVQIVVDAARLEASSDSNPVNPVKKLGSILQRGDHVQVQGLPCRTQTGELSLLASSLPQILSPCLHAPPQETPKDDSDLAHERHVEMMADPSIIETIVARSHIIDSLQSDLRRLGFINVQTPILAATAGGAIARPFETAATEFPERKLSLRIAPELWLKRLIVGGMQRVFELGPSFRNEGLDKTHNPEFTTCEFYAAYWTLEDLIQQTQSMFFNIATQLSRASPQAHPLDPSFKTSIRMDEKCQTWLQIDFIPALNSALGIDLPNLSAPNAQSQLIQIFTQQNIPLPSHPSLPRLLDKLSAEFLEPQCDDATWIINLPECLSPLAKSFTHPTAPNDQRVAARAELFIKRKEVVNCYEEENSPVEQRRKFLDQRRYATSDEYGGQEDPEAMKVDEQYLRALEWGLPPTGGWGCGIDRLVMLALAKEKIADVLAFGSLRMVTREADTAKGT